MPYESPSAPSEDSRIETAVPDNWNAVAPTEDSGDESEPDAKEAVVLIWLGALRTAVRV